MKYNNNDNIYKNITPRKKFLDNDKISTNSNNKSQNSNNDNYGAYSFKNVSINLEKIDVGNNNSTKNNEINKNKEIPISHPNINNNINAQKDLKTQIKQNLVNKLKQDEEERKRIKEEIRKIEKRQYDLWMNFSENMKSGNTTFNNNINSNHKEFDFFNRDEDIENDNIVNYDYV